MYEGLSALQVVEPALLMHRLGARTLVLTNAAGGVDPSFEAGTLMLISDHLNLTGRTPLLGPNDDALGPRFLDLTAVYDPVHRAALRAAATAEDVTLAEGVYAGLLGPDLRDTRPRCACWASSARTPWACPRSWRPSPRIGSACVSWASRW